MITWNDIRDRFEGGVTKGCVTFRFLTLKMCHFSKKRHFLRKKGQNIQCLTSKIFAAPSAPQNTPIYPYFCVLLHFYLTNFSKNKRFFVFIPFFPNFSLNGIISLSFSYIFLGMPRFFGEGGGSTPKIAMEQKMEQGSHRGRSHP